MVLSLNSHPTGCFSVVRSNLLLGRRAFPSKTVAMNDNPGLKTGEAQQGGYGITLQARQERGAVTRHYRTDRDVKLVHEIPLQ